TEVVRLEGLDVGHQESPPAGVPRGAGVAQPDGSSPALPPTPPSRCHSVSGSSFALPVAHIRAAPDPSANNGAVPCSGGLAGPSTPPPFRRLALIRAIVRRAASRLAGLAGLRHGSVAIRKGQDGHSTAVHSATSFAWLPQQSRHRARIACSGGMGS